MPPARRWPALLWCAVAAAAAGAAGDAAGEGGTQRCASGAAPSARAPQLLQRTARLSDAQVDSAVEIATGDFSYGFGALIESGIADAGLRAFLGQRSGIVGAPCSATADCGWHQRCDKSGPGPSQRARKGELASAADAEEGGASEPAGGSPAASEGVCAPLHLGEQPLADAAMGAASFVIAGVSLAAGVGGGGVFVPTLMLTLAFDSRTATALSQSMLLGGATAAFAYNLGHRHPADEARPLIDFELACLLGPGLLAGAQVGSIAHAVAPPALLLGTLFLVLGDAARKGINSALKLSKKEDWQAAAALQRTGAAVSGGAAEAPPAQKSAAAPRPSPAPTGSGGASAADEPDRRPLVEENAPTVLLCIWLVSLVGILCKGLLVELCSLSWWLLVLGFTWALLLFALYSAKEISRQAPLAGEEGVPDFHQYSFVLMRWSVLAGVLASMCGIGGGMVLGPILVQFDVPPRVSSATTATTLLILSSSASLVYGCRGFAPVDYSVYLSIVTFFGALSGKVLVGRVVRRSGKESIILFLLAGITVISCLLMGALGMVRMWYMGRAAFSFTSLCSQQYNEVANKVIHVGTSNETAAAAEAAQGASELLMRLKARAAFVKVLS